VSREIEKLRAREAQIKRRIAEIQARTKNAERKQRTARLIRWDVVVEAMMKAQKIEATEWVAACREVLSARDFEIATAEILSRSSDRAQLEEGASAPSRIPDASNRQGTSVPLDRVERLRRNSSEAALAAVVWQEEGRAP
jgi:chromosome segregation ATPase